MVISRLSVLVSGFGGDFGLVHTTLAAVLGWFRVFQDVSGSVVNGHDCVRRRNSDPSLDQYNTLVALLVNSTIMPAKARSKIVVVSFYIMLLCGFRVQLQGGCRVPLASHLAYFPFLGSSESRRHSCGRSPGCGVLAAAPGHAVNLGVLSQLNFTAYCG